MASLTLNLTQSKKIQSQKPHKAEYVLSPAKAKPVAVLVKLTLASLILNIHIHNRLMALHKRLLKPGSITDKLYFLFFNHFLKVYNLALQSM